MIIENPICGIYKITNKLNGKYYIGSSKNIQLNWIIHTLNYINKEQHPLYNEMWQYGIENFEFSILETCSKDYLQKTYNYYKNLFQTNNIDYNQFEPPYLKNDEKILRKNIEIKNYEIINELTPPLTLDFNKQHNEFIIHSTPNKNKRQIKIIQDNKEIIGIYIIINKINNKCYIGQSNNIYKRWEEHKANTKTKRNNNPLYKDMRKYGLNYFKFEILEECNEDELNDKEKYWIEQYNSIQPNGYNFKSSGGVNRKYLFKKYLQKISN